MSTKTLIRLTALIALVLSAASSEALAFNNTIHPIRTTIVRDHRGDSSHGSSQPPPCIVDCGVPHGKGKGSPDVRDHRPIPCLGNLC